MLWAVVPEASVNEYRQMFLGEHYVWMHNPSVGQSDGMILPESKSSVVK